LLRRYASRKDTWGAEITELVPKHKAKDLAPRIDIIQDCFGHWDFEFRYCLELRISYLGLVICFLAIP